MLAAIDAQIIFVIIAGIIGFINWLTKKDEPSDDHAPSPKFPRTTSTRPTPSRPAPKIDAGDPAAERTRKFLEALGLPTDQPPPIRPAPVRRERSPDPRMRPAPPLPAPVALPPVLPRPRSLDELPPPTRPVEQLHIPELRTPEVREFHTRTGEISAIPQAAALLEPDAYAVAGEHSSESFRALLRSPQELRRTILLREIFGPPRSLQS